MRGASDSLITGAERHPASRRTILFPLDAQRSALSVEGYVNAVYVYLLLIPLVLNDDAARHLVAVISRSRLS